MVESSPISVTFETVHTRIPISFTILDDKIEEGYENFTLQLSYNEMDEHGTVQIVTESAKISIKDDDGGFIVVTLASYYISRVYIMYIRLTRLGL